MYLVINKWVTAVKFSNFSCHYLRNRSTLDIGVLGYIGIVQHKEHSPEVLSIPPGKSCIYVCVSLNDGDTFWETRRWAISSLYERVLTQTQTVQYSLLHTYAIWYSLLLLGYKAVQHVTVLNSVGNCNTMISIIILYYNIMGPPSYMRSVVDRNVAMRRMTVYLHTFRSCPWAVLKI